MSIAGNLKQINSTLPNEARLIAVSKTHPPSVIAEAYAAGQRVFGENKAQEMVEKHAHLPADIEWHMIGHLQTNKVKYIAPFVHLIHSVDSLSLLQVIEREATKNSRVIDCLLQLKIAREESKYGLAADDVFRLLNDEAFKRLGNVRVTGLMGMATFTSDKHQVEREFTFLSEVFEKCKAGWFYDKPYFRERSMGMSDDYLLAIRCGSTMVRVGGLIFGERIYSKT